MGFFAEVLGRLELAVFLQDRINVGGGLVWHVIPSFSDFTDTDSNLPEGSRSHDVGSELSRSVEAPICFLFGTAFCLVEQTL